MPVWIPESYHTTSEWSSWPNQPYHWASCSCLSIIQLMGSCVLHITPCSWCFGQTAQAPCKGVAHITAADTGFHSAPFKRSSVIAWSLKCLLWVLLESAKGLREVHSPSWDPWWAWISFLSTTLLLATPLQVNEGPDLQFFLTRPKALSFSHQGRQGTQTQASEKFKYQNTNRNF